MWIRNLVYFSWLLCTGSHKLKSRFQLTQSPLLGTGLPCTHGWGRPETLEATQNSVYHIHLYLLQLVTSGIIFIILLLALHLLCLYYLFVTISDVKWLPKRHQCRKSKRLRFNPWVGKIPWRKLSPNMVTSVQFSSVAQSCPTLCDPMNCSTPGLPVHHQLPEFTQTHVH